MSAVAERMAKAFKQATGESKPVSSSWVQNAWEHQAYTSYADESDATTSPQNAGSSAPAKPKAHKHA